MTSSFGARLRALRKQRGISQRTLAAAVEIDFTYISKLEHDAMPPPSAVTIRRMAEVLRADENELFCLTGKVPDGLHLLLKGNPLLTELVRELSKRRLPDAVYQQMIAWAREAHKEEQ